MDVTHLLRKILKPLMIFDNVKKSTYYDVILFLSYHKIFKKNFQNIASSKNRNKILDPFNYYS